jgi:hypothetical protein
VKFILTFTNWEHAERISLQQLILVLNETDDKKLDAAKRYAIEKLRGWPSSQAVLFDNDPHLNEIKKYRRRDLKS